MKSMLKWACVTIGMGAVWMVTRTVVFYFIGVVAAFATAFQATVNALSRMGEEPQKAVAPELRVQRDARLTAGLIDLAALEGSRESVASNS